MQQRIRERVRRLERHPAYKLTQQPAEMPAEDRRVLETDAEAMALHVRIGQLWDDACRRYPHLPTLRKPRDLIASLLSLPDAWDLLNAMNELCRRIALVRSQEATK